MIREDEMTEFKKTTSEINEAMISIASILNKHGQGKIYFGLKNDGTPNKFIITDLTLRDVSRKIYESIKPQIFPEIKTEYINGIEIIIVIFEGKEKPYSAFGKYYKRVADEDREMSPNELRSMMIAQEYEENWENKSSQETINDVDERILNSFYINATTCGRLPELETDKKSLMKKMGLLNGEKLTNAGKMLYSKNQPITLKMAVFATEHKNTFLDIARVEGNIFQLIQEAISYIIKNIRWSSYIADDGIHRIEKPEIPLDAIREAVINSFAHARYDLSVQHEIDIYSNRISITNPGSFANDFLPEDFATRDLHSFLRNELISKTLYLCKDVETFGSGLRKIYTLCKEDRVKINYINSESDFTIEFFRQDRNIMSDNGRINDIENQILEILRKDGRITIGEMVDICQKSERTITRTISSLKTKKLIERIGSNKTGFWKVK